LNGFQPSKAGLALNVAERIRAIIDECEEGRELTDEERYLLADFVNHYGNLFTTTEDVPIIKRARACLIAPTQVSSR
jgi:hypothetical protein